MNLRKLTYSVKFPVCSFKWINLLSHDHHSVLGKKKDFLIVLKSLNLTNDAFALKVERLWNFFSTLKNYVLCTSNILVRFILAHM